MTLAFPRVAAPLASIVMPTHNGWGWARRTLDAIREHTDQPYEVIVCDNASSDETPRRLTEMENARVVLNTENLGFGTACNQGAALARSPYVVFLNSDAVVHENWLAAAPAAPRIEPRRRRWTAAPEQDGSIQASGSTLLGDGWPVDHRDGSADVGFPRVVDYVAGACLATRRASFHGVGGFDASFGLAYYEDVDLCCRLRSAGYDVVVEPRSVVTHALGVSSDQELKDHLEARNQLLFVARWRHAFAGRPPFEESGALPPVFLRDLSADARLLLLPGRRTESCRDLATRLVSRRPNVRVTVLGTQPPDVRSPSNGSLRRIGPPRFAIDASTTTPSSRSTSTTASG